MASDIRVRVFRFNPEEKAEPRFDLFSVPYSKGMTILDCLIYIKEHLDSTLAFRSSCRMGICGSCGVMVNGFPHLACHTQVSELGTDRLELRPLANYDVIKDLVVDLTPLFNKHKMVKPYLISPQLTADHVREFAQTPLELERYLQFSYCVKCGLCIAACPTCATDKQFLGPQALAQVFRYNMDSRDVGSKDRIQVIDQPHGLWRCHLAGACSDVCPKGVDPALAIQLLKRSVVGSWLGLTKRNMPRLVEEQEKQAPADAPKAPPLSV